MLCSRAETKLLTAGVRKEEKGGARYSTARTSHQFIAYSKLITYSTVQCERVHNNVWYAGVVSFLSGQCQQWQDLQKKNSALRKNEIVGFINLRARLNSYLPFWYILLLDEYSFFSIICIIETMVF